MISIVLYGRNDNYGYNLHKRVALSLNCMAEVLTGPDDEILFVDYNTDDDFPTFPEAIHDTLTEKAVKRLRIFRVRPAIHARWKKSTHLFTLEAIARNVAVRRSNENNRFILSTNTDMIFVPRQDISLTDTVGDLPYGYYGLPRFELPETSWESLDRKDPQKIIASLGKWGWNLWLNEIVYGSTEDKFDAPGDFQLIERKDLFAIDGFNESMLLGWHIDNNMAKRLHFIHPETSDLSCKCYGYHCDHTRQVTPIHKRSAPEDDFDFFVTDLKEAHVASQRDVWGCAKDEIEEISLAKPASRIYIDALEKTLGAPLQSPLEAAFTFNEHWDRITYEPRHVLPFVLDLLMCLPRDLSVSYFGGHRAMYDLLHDSLQCIGFERPMLVTQATASRLGLSPGDRGIAESVDVFAAGIFVFDWVTIEGKAVSTPMSEANRSLIDDLVRSFYRIVDAERKNHHSESGTPRRIVMINAIENRFEALVRRYLDYARTPFSSRLRHGFVRRSGKVGPFHAVKERSDRRGLRRWILTASRAKMK